jgi:hypothetical protein
MRKLFFLLVSVSILGFPSAISKASQGATNQKQALKAQQKQERRAFKLKDHNQMQAYKTRGVPKGVRDQQKHELQREKRAMRDRQKDQLQDLKDRKKLVKESARQR